MKIALFLGTVREGRMSEPVAKFVEQVASKRDDVEVDLIDPKQCGFSLEKEGRQVAEDHPILTEKIEKADAYIIVTPEYNHGYPGGLKYILDTHLKEYIHKPVALVGVSSGPFGGTRVIEALLSVVRELGMAVTFEDVNFSSINDEVENGEIKDKDKWEKRVNKMLDELLWMAEALKWGRENLESEY